MCFRNCGCWCSKQHKLPGTGRVSPNGGTKNTRSVLTLCISSTPARRLASRERAAVFVSFGREEAGLLVNREVGRSAVACIIWTFIMRLDYFLWAQRGAVVIKPLETGVNSVDYRSTTTVVCRLDFGGCDGEREHPGILVAGEDISPLPHTHVICLSTRNSLVPHSSSSRGISYIGGTYMGAPKQCQAVLFFMGSYLSTIISPLD